MSLSISTPRALAIIYPERRAAHGGEHASVRVDRHNQGSWTSFRIGPMCSWRVTCSGIRSRGSEDRHAPDTMVVFGRPKGYRGSYRQWEEEGSRPRSSSSPVPGNRPGDDRKFSSTSMVVQDTTFTIPMNVELSGYQRTGKELVEIG